MTEGIVPGRRGTHAWRITQNIRHLGHESAWAEELGRSQEFMACFIKRVMFDSCYLSQFAITLRKSRLS